MAMQRLKRPRTQTALDLRTPGRKPADKLGVNRRNLPYGVEYAIPFQGAFNNVAGPAGFDAIPAGVDITSTPYGTGALITGAGFIDLDESLMDAVAADSITIAGIYYYPGADDNAQFFDGRQGTNDGYEVAVSRNLIIFTVDHGGVDSISVGDSGDLTPGLRWFVARFDGSDLKLVSSHAGAATPVSHPGSAINGNSWRLGNSYNPNTPFGDVGVLLGAVFDSTPWTDRQAQEFIDNPWGFAFRPANEAVFRADVGSGGGTTIEADPLPAAASLQASVATGASIAAGPLSAVKALLADVATGAAHDASPLASAVTLQGVPATGAAVPADVLQAALSLQAETGSGVSHNADPLAAAVALSAGQATGAAVFADALSAALSLSAQSATGVSIDADAWALTVELQGTQGSIVAINADPLTAQASISALASAGVVVQADVIGADGALLGTVNVGGSIIADPLTLAGALSADAATGAYVDADPLTAVFSLLGDAVGGVSVSADPLVLSSAVSAQVAAGVAVAAEALLLQGTFSGVASIGGLPSISNPTLRAAGGVVRTLMTIRKIN